jgi:hypothetical protein
LILIPFLRFLILLVFLIKFSVLLSVLEVILGNAGIPLNKVDYPSKQDRTALINYAESLATVSNKKYLHQVLATSETD